MNLTVDPRAAAQSLLAWWEAAGVDIAPPLAPASRPAARPPGAAPAPAPGRQPLQAPPSRQGAPARQAPPPKPATPPPLSQLELDAKTVAARCTSLEALEAVLKTFDHPLRAAARSTVFARGDRTADVMLVGEAPGREEDLEGLPFVGRSGQLLDRMFAEIGLTAEKGLYITNIVNWRPRNNRSPSEEDVALCRPFIFRHVALKKPKLIVLAGAIAAQTLLGTTQGITRLRGKWMLCKTTTPEGAPLEIPALPIYHPAYVLRRPISKREVWRDLLTLQERLGSA